MGVRDERRAWSPARRSMPPKPVSQPGGMRREPGMPAAIRARPAAVSVWPVSSPLADTIGVPGRAWLIPLGMVIIFAGVGGGVLAEGLPAGAAGRSEEHTSELQSRPHLVC